MSSAGTAVAKMAINEKMGNMKGYIDGQQKIQINWADYNYPPLVNVIHFRLDELTSNPDIRAQVRNIWISHLVLFAVSILNLISNIAQAAGLVGQGMRIFYSFMFFFLFNSLHTLYFYWGYKGITVEKSLLNRVKYLGILLAILYLIFSIVDWVNFDGWIRVSYLFSQGQGFAAVIGLIESISLTLLYIFLGFFTYKVQLMI